MSILDLRTLAFLAFAAGLLLFGGSPNSGYAQVFDNEVEEVEETNGFEEDLEEEEECPPVEEDVDEEDYFENEETPEDETESSRW